MYLVRMVEVAFQVAVLLLVAVPEGMAPVEGVPVGVGLVVAPGVGLDSSVPLAFLS